MHTDILLQHLIANYDSLKYALLKAQSFDANHFGFPAMYYKIMETDTQRINAFKNAFLRHNNLKDSVVCEVGVGNLPLTKLYMPYVKKAYLIESNPQIIPFIKQEIAKHPWADKVVFIQANALDVVLPEKVDYVIGELMSIYCANELQVQIFQHMCRFLKPNGILLPQRIINFARLCYADFDTDISHYPVMFTRHQPMFLSQQFLVHQIDLYKEDKQDIHLCLSGVALLSGTINALYLESYIEITPGANFTGTDSLMPPTVLKTINTLEVNAGSVVQIELCFTYGDSLDTARCTLS